MFDSIGTVLNLSQSLAQSPNCLCSYTKLVSFISVPKLAHGGSFVVKTHGNSEIFPIGKSLLGKTSTSMERDNT